MPRPGQIVLAVDFEVVAVGELVEEMLRAEGLRVYTALCSAANHQAVIEEAVEKYAPAVIVVLYGFEEWALSTHFERVARQNSANLIYLPRLNRLTWLADLADNKDIIMNEIVEEAYQLTATSH